MPWKIILMLILCLLSGSAGWKLRDTAQPVVTAYTCSTGFFDALTFWN
ncbi:hypothetical protein SPB21_22525 [Leptothoe sp. ISB3NOV94-8A]|nr:hypothetical protein [Adonisia turfae]MDV3352004.1 hypothetical protein [Leptothoe sp. LEGE 181152]